MFEDINWWAVGVAAIASMVVGALWYSPILFGNLWMRLSGISMDKIGEAKQKGMTKYYVGALIAEILTSLVLALALSFTGVEGVLGSIKIAFWIWLGFLLTWSFNSVLWEGKPIKLYILNNAHRLVTLVIIAAILGSWM